METWTEDRQLLLFKAAVHGDWSSAERIFKEDPAALTAKVLGFEETVLHISVAAGHSIQFVKKLVDLLPPESVAIENRDKNNPLHAAAMVGNIEAAKILVRKNSTLTQGRNILNATPLHYAASYAHKETVCYLLSVTRDEDPSPFANEQGVSLLNSLIDADYYATEQGVRLLSSLIIADFYGIALDLLKRYPALALGTDQSGMTALQMLAKKPRAFPSGNRLARFHRFLYHYFSDTSADRKTETVPTGKDVENPGRVSKEYQEETKQFHFLQLIRDKMVMHNQAKKLLTLLISEVSKASLPELRNLLVSPTLSAATLGIQEFVVEAIKSYPFIVWHRNGEGNTIFLLAVKHRQEKIFNLLYQMSNYIHIVTSLTDSKGNNMLHLAGKLEPSSKISGAALQMQRELQWFKEVEKVVKPSYKDYKIKDARDNVARTPRMVFTEEHKNLVEKGEKWMKETASSCATVAALVVTVMFAAAFTTPGGTDQGVPIYLDKTSLMVFIISDALGLFTSSASLLMFLGILTSRYSEEDFLKSLPVKMSIGLVALFFSIGFMLVAFSAAVHLVLFHKVKWIAVPVGLIACGPVVLFAVLQFRLLLAMVSATFGPSIFRKESEEMIL